jgi:hypothetical protein
MRINNKVNLIKVNSFSILNKLGYFRTLQVQNYYEIRKWSSLPKGGIKLNLKIMILILVAKSINKFIYIFIHYRVKAGPFHNIVYILFN